MAQLGEERNNCSGAPHGRVGNAIREGREDSHLALPGSSSGTWGRGSDRKCEGSRRERPLLDSCPTQGQSAENCSQGTRKESQKSEIIEGASLGGELSAHGSEKKCFLFLDSQKTLSQGIYTIFDSKPFGAGIPLLPASVLL